MNPKNSFTLLDISRLIAESGHAEKLGETNIFYLIDENNELEYDGRDILIQEIYNKKTKETCWWNISFRWVMWELPEERKLIPAFTAQQMFDGLPDWVKNGFKTDLGAALDDKPRKDLPDFSHIKESVEISNIIAKHWGNWLRIFAELWLYCAEKGMLVVE